VVRARSGWVRRVCPALPGGADGRGARCSAPAPWRVGRCGTRHASDRRQGDRHQRGDGAGRTVERI